MHQNKRRAISLAIMAALVLATIFGVNGWLRGKQSRASGAQPPVEKLHAFSLSNAPTAVTSSWSTNMPSDPAKVQVMQQVAARVVANQSAKLPTNTAPEATGFRDARQAEAMRQLQQRVGGSLQVYLRPENSTPIQLKGYPLAKAVATVGDEARRNEATAESFLRDNAALLLLNDPDRELQLANRQADPLGGEVLRFTQKYHGVPVWPAEIGVHLDAAGDINLVDGAYIATPVDVSVQPKLTATDAKARARDAVGGGAMAKVGSPELVVYSPMDAPAKLGWKVDVSMALDQAWWVVVDAQTGEKLTAISRVMSDSVSGSGVDLFGITRPLNVWHAGAKYYMIDASKPMFNATAGQGVIEVDDALGTNISVLQNTYYVTSASANSWSVPDSVSASYNLSQTYDYYQSRFGRSSYNGAGSNLNAIVRIGSYANASWNNELKMMLFGNVDKYAGSLDVIGHEVTHGVAFSIGSEGVLKYQGQSGALNEAFADVFGEMIEARTRGTNDWWIGSDLNAALRYLADPGSVLIDGIRPYPSRMSDFIQPDDPFLDYFIGRDNGGVHLNSSIIGHAYYLLAAGLDDPIGEQDAEQIFYRCLTLSMKPFSQFIDARLGCIAAAEALFGTNSQQALKTAEAFDAVELYAAPVSAPQPSNVNAAVAAPDSYMFIREHWFYTRDDLFRIEAARGDTTNGSSLVTSVRVTRPSVTGDGADMFFVGADDSLCYLTTVGTNFKLRTSKP